MNFTYATVQWLENFAYKFELLQLKVTNIIMCVREFSLPSGIECKLLIYSSLSISTDIDFKSLHFRFQRNNRNIGFN